MTDSIYSKIVDCHCHTEFAYCGSGVTADEAINRSRAAGLRGVCLTEHGPQLYVAPEEFWEARHVNEMLWRDNPASRMKKFKEFMATRRSDFVLAGFEVELDAEGYLTITDEDRQWADIVVGAIHWLPGEPLSLSNAEFVRHFMDTTLKIIEGGVHILAHPFRLFRSRKQQIDKSLYPEVADALLATNTAAELNLHHTSVPDPDFYSVCIDKGVKISLASDSHFVDQIGDFSGHIEILRDVVGSDNIADVLYVPEQMR